MYIDGETIVHLAELLGALAVGETTIEGLLEGEDVLATAAAMRAFGATVTRDAGGTGCFVRTLVELARHYEK